MSRSPFPGMDPYLESPLLWSDLHSTLPTIFREQLAPLLAPKYVAELETQIVIEQVVDDDDDDWQPRPARKTIIPDLTITRPGPSASALLTMPIAAAPLVLQLPIAVPTRLVTVHIRKRETERLVAVIELLSSVNKRSGKQRQAYLEKRSAYIESGTHFIEIDLLRKWKRMPLTGQVPKSDYLVVVSDAYEYPDCHVWPIGVRDPLPVLPVPLVRPDPPVPLDLGKALRTAYERARYDLRINYHSPAQPRLSPEDAAWAITLIENHD